MGVLFTNNATTTLSAGINTAATTITVAAGAGALFPVITGSDHFYATLVDASNNIEIVKVTARSTDSMTVVRAQEGTTARSYSSGDKFELRPTAASLNSFYSKEGGTLTGKVVGVTSTTATASLNVPHGVDPTSPVNGDIWSVTTGFYARLNGATVTFTLNDATQTLTNKTVALGSNTVSGTIAQFNTACTDADFATLAGTETLTNKTLTSPAVNGATINAGSTISDAGTIAANSPGFRGLPPSAQPGGSNITLALADAGRSVPNTVGGWTIPANSSVAFPLWTVVVLYNDSAVSQTLAITTDTLYLAGTTSTGSRTVLPRGFATCVKVGTTSWVVSGAG